MQAEFVRNEQSQYTTGVTPLSTSIYHVGVVQVAAHFGIGRPTDAVVVTNWNTAAIGLTPAQLTAIQSAFDTVMVAQFKTFLSGPNHYNGSVVTDMSSNTGGQVTNASFVPVAGTGGTTPLSDSVAILISLHTPTRYRGGHGRMYLPGFDISQTNPDGRTLPTSRVNAIAAAWQAVQNAMTAIAGASGGPYVQLVWHKHLTSAPNTIELVGSFTVQSILASQRRRIRKVSRHRRP